MRPYHYPHRHLNHRLPPKALGLRYPPRSPGVLRLSFASVPWPGTPPRFSPRPKGDNDSWPRERGPRGWKTGKGDPPPDRLPYPEGLAYWWLASVGTSPVQEPPHPSVTRKTKHREGRHLEWGVRSGLQVRLRAQLELSQPACLPEEATLGRAKVRPCLSRCGSLRQRTFVPAHTPVSWWLSHLDFLGEHSFPLSAHVVQPGLTLPLVHRDVPRIQV